MFCVYILQGEVIVKAFQMTWPWYAEEVYRVPPGPTQHQTLSKYLCSSHVTEK